jgi:hypothetical protein
MATMGGGAGYLLTMADVAEPRDAKGTGDVTGRLMRFVARYDARRRYGVITAMLTVARRAKNAMSQKLAV